MKFETNFIGNNLICEIRSNRNA